MIKLTKKEARVLRHLITISDNDLSGEINYTYTMKNMPYIKFNIILKILMQAGYVECVRAKEIIRFKITPDGYEYFDRNKISMWEQIYNIIMSKSADIIVAFVTAVITYFVMPYMLLLFK